MIDEAAVGMRLTIDIIDCVQVVLETFIYSNSVALCLAPVVRHQGLIQLCLLVYFAQLILLQGFLSTSLFFL